MSQDDTKPEPPGPLQVLKSACMAALGVQRDSVRRRDFERGRPRDFIVAGILLTAVFVVSLIGLVKLILFFAGAP
jgi:hypothetical protein